MRRFLEEYTNQHIRDESTLKTSNLLKLYDKHLKELRANFKSKLIWILTDEVSTFTDRQIAAVMAWIINPAFCEAPYIIHVAELESVNYKTIAATINDTLRVLHNFYFIK